MIAIGESSLDRVCVVDGLPPPGGKRAALAFDALPGGQMATAALACATLGLRAAYVGAVGDDADGEAALAPLARAGVDLSGVRRVAGAPTRTAVIWVDRDSGERSIVWHRDPRLALRPEDLAGVPLERAGAVLLDACDPAAALHAAGRARQGGAAAVLDADTPAPELRALCAAVDFPIVSRQLAETFSEQGDVREGLAAIAAGGARLAVATLGPDGALAAAGEQVTACPGFRVEVVDTTGAGDVFHAAFVWALLTGGTEVSVLRAACAAAALSCRGRGAQGSLPTRAELEGFLGEQGP